MVAVITQKVLIVDLPLMFSIIQTLSSQDDTVTAIEFCLRVV